MNETTPKRFGKYLLLDRIALGGMAELYRAMITGVQGFEKLIAVKKILPHLTIEEELVHSFIDEAKLAALLHHQNIVQIYDFGSVEKSYFIAMEYLFGKDLRYVTEKAKQTGRPLSLEHALFIVSRVASGLHYAHNLKDFQGKPLNIIHRDISPQNVFITYEGDVKVVDFGIAKAATQSTMTQVGMIKGKVAYMSPEQAEGKAIDYRSDIFSLGIILYELVTGQRMFQGDTMQILSKVRSGEFVSADQIVKDLPDKLYEILNHALAKDAEKRYESCNDMLSDLEECMYAFSRRPTTRGLSEYMKGLFEGEIAEEEKTMSRLAGLDLGNVPKAESAAPEAETFRESAELAQPDLPKRSGRKNLLLAAVAGVIVIVALIFVFRPGEKSTEKAPVAQKVEETKSLPEPSGKTHETAKAEVPAPAPKQKETSNAAEGTVGAQEKSASAAPPAQEQEAGKIEQAQQALGAKRYSTAVALFEAAFAEKPDLEAKMKGPYEEALLGKADSLKKTDPAAREKLLLKAVDVDPDSVKAHFELGLLYVQNRNFPEAIKQYEKVKELDPNSTDAFFNLGYLYAMSKDYENAEKAYQRVVELKPEYLDEALFNLAMVERRLGKKAECIANLKKALKVNPKNERVRNYLKMIQ